MFFMTMLNSTFTTFQRLNLPDEFHEFIDYCRSLAFADQPDYAFWKQRFQKLLDVAAT